MVRGRVGKGHRTAPRAAPPRGGDRSRTGQNLRRSVWTDRDWVNQFRLLHGGQARLRGVTQVSVRDTDGEIMWEGGVREFDRGGEGVGYAWFVQARDGRRLTTAVQSGAIHCAEDAVRAQL